jgi:ketosteroid isomerase-like protein
MRKYVYLFFFVIFLVGLSSSGAEISGSFFAKTDDQQDKTAADVREVEKRRVQFLTSGDLARLAELLSDNLIYTHSTGRVENKTKLLAALRSGEPRYEAMKHEDVQVRIYGETAVLTGRSLIKLKTKGQQLTVPVRFTLIYVKEAGKWKLLAWQSTGPETQ